MHWSSLPEGRKKHFLKIDVLFLCYFPNYTYVYIFSSGICSQRCWLCTPGYHRNRHGVTRDWFSLPPGRSYVGETHQDNCTVPVPNGMSSPKRRWVLIIVVYFLSFVIVPNCFVSNKNLSSQTSLVREVSFIHDFCIWNISLSVEHATKTNFVSIVLFFPCFVFEVQICFISFKLIPLQGWILNQFLIQPLLAGKYGTFCHLFSYCH